MKPLCSLEVLDNLKEISCFEGYRLDLAWASSICQVVLFGDSKLFKSNGHIDIVIKYRLPRACRCPARRHWTPLAQSSFQRGCQIQWERACTVSLNSRVRGISSLLRLALLVVRRIRSCAVAMSISCRFFVHPPSKITTESPSSPK